MATVFYVIGWLVIIAGVAVAGFAVVGASQMMRTYGAETMMAGAVGIGVASGLGIAFSGLLILAIGGVLSRLDKIVWNTDRPR